MNVTTLLSFLSCRYKLSNSCWTDWTSFFEVYLSLPCGKAWKRGTKRQQCGKANLYSHFTTHAISFLTIIIMSNERPSKNNRTNKLTHFFKEKKGKISSLFRPSRSSISLLIDAGSSSDQTVATTGAETR